MSVAYAINDDLPANDTAPALQPIFDRVGSTVSFARDEEIYAQDGRADMLYMVVSGVVRTSRLAGGGRRQLGEFYYPGDIFGLEVGPYRAFSADGLTDVEVRVIRRSVVRALGREEELERAILHATRQELARARSHVLMLGLKNARDKVGAFLAGVAKASDGVDADLVMSRQDIADYLGLTIETVSRMLTQLQGDRVVEFSGSRRFRMRSQPDLDALAV